jgi:hypothetical protein
MLSITRALAHKLHTVFRQVLRAGAQTSALPIVLQADSSGLTVRCQGSEMAAAYHEPGSFPSETIVLPEEALKDCAGRTPSDVTFEEAGSGEVHVQWDMEGFTRNKNYRAIAPESLPPWPQMSAHLEAYPPDFLPALHEAAKTTADNSGRYIMDRVQLRGTAGEIIGTDGKELFIAGGFPFPWTEDLLVPPLTVFDNRILRSDSPAEVGHTDTHLCIRTEGWTFYLTLDRKSRYPDVDAVLRPLSQHTTRWLIGPEDADLLKRVLPRLPKGEDDVARLEVELGDPVVLRAGVHGSEEEMQRGLAHSQVQGEPLRVVMNPLYLWRAVCLGFTEVRLKGPNHPLLCEDERRKYVWMPFISPVPSRPGDPEAPF